MWQWLESYIKVNYITIIFTMQARTKISLKEANAKLTGLEAEMEKINESNGSLNLQLEALGVRTLWCTCRR